MKILGIDLSSQPQGTAAAVIQWTATQGIAQLYSGCDDASLRSLIAEASVIGIDAPFGWPEEFRVAVQSWPHCEWNDALRDAMTLRETDRFVMKQHGGRPLSVSADRIALPAMRAISLLAYFGVTDRAGDGRFYEVYPKASLNAWGISPRFYKSAKEPNALPARQAILARLREQLPWLRVDETFAHSADGLDALIAALSARVAAQGHTHRPSPELAVIAKTEGWIHIPTTWPTLG